MPQLLKYFAYGSNLHPHRLRQRVPSSRPLGKAVLPGHRLRFHKNGRDGSGKCNVLHTGKESHQVIGVIYEMHPGERPLLDAAEGLGNGYELTHQQVHAGDDRHEVFFYVAQAAHIDDSLLPYCWYKDLVVHGARRHQLPAEYVEALTRVPSRRDPDEARHALHQRILWGDG